MDTLAKVVGVTLGPRGRLVIIDRKFGAPQITKDGVSVAKEIDLEDNNENLGAQLVREVAEKTSDQVGDGTTTATVLAQAILEGGLKNVTAGANPMALKRGIDKAVEKIVEFIKTLSKPVKGNEEIAAVAAVSANNDPAIGQLRYLAEGLSSSDCAQELGHICLDLVGGKAAGRNAMLEDFPQGAAGLDDLRR